MLRPAIVARRLAPAALAGLLFLGHLAPVQAARPAPMPLPDLVVSALACDPIPGNQIIIVVTVKNIGSAPAGPSTTNLYRDGGLVSSWATPGLAPGDDVWFMATLPDLPGLHVYTGRADATAAVKERRENNNRTSRRCE